MSRGIPLGLLLAVLGTLGCAPRSSDDPPSRPGSAGEPGWLIAYNVLHDAENDDYEIFVMDADGSGARNVTNHPAVDWVYYSHGGKLFFLSDRDDERRKYHLYEMDHDGGNVRRITDFRLIDSWLSSRRDGSELVVASRKDGMHDLYVIDRDGNELRRLTEDEHRDSDPCFSPDGDRVVFRSDRSGRDELWMLDVGGGEPRRLTHYPEDQQTPNPHLYHAGPPVWERGRNIISYTSHRDGNYSIFTIPPEGGEATRLTHGAFDEGWHAWSPDGRLLAYDGTDESGNYDIYLLEVDSGRLTRLTDGPLHEQAPVFVERFAVDG